MQGVVFPPGRICFRDYVQECVRGQLYEQCCESKISTETWLSPSNQTDLESRMAEYPQRQQCKNGGIPKNTSQLLCLYFVVLRY